jgi:site-specific recombinase XerD
MELYKTRGSDLMDNETAIIYGKSGSKEIIHLTPAGVDIYKARSNGSELLFADARASCYKFYKVVESLGLNDNSTGKVDRVWFHTLRHTYASWLVQDGVDIYVVQKLMRHKSITMTERYAHLNQETIASPLEKIKRWNLTL